MQLSGFGTLLNTSPEVRITPVPGVHSREIALEFEIADADSDTVSVSYVLPRGKAASANGLVRVIPQGFGRHTVIWDSWTDLPDTSGIFQFILIARDRQEESADTVTVAIDNQAPALNRVSGNYEDRRVVLTFSEPVANLSGVRFEPAHEVVEVGPIGGDSVVVRIADPLPASTLEVFATEVEDSLGNMARELRYSFTPKLPPPVADFSATPLSGQEPLAVTFTDLSTGVVSTYRWNFGDGGVSTQPNPTHTYTQAGTYTVELTVTNESGSHTVTKPNLITLTVPRGIRLSAAQLDFGQVVLGEEKTGVLKIENPGDSLLHISRIFLQGTGFSVKRDSLSIGPRSSDSLLVLFTAAEASPVEGTLFLESNATNDPQVQVGLRAQGITPGKLHILPASLLFEQLKIGRADTLSLSLSNQGQAALRIGQIYAEDAQFVVLDSLSSLASGESREVRVVFAPTEEGALQTDLVVESDDQVQPVARVMLSGEGRPANRLPAVAVSTTGTRQAGDVGIDYTLADPDEDTLAVTAEFSRDGGTTWEPATLTGETQGLTPEKYAGNLLWQSTVDLPGFEDRVFLRIIPDDGVPGQEDTLVVSVDNNLPPAVTFELPETGARQVRIRYRVEDAEADQVTLDITYSTDGTNWKSAALVLDGTGETSQAGEVFWDALADLGYGIIPVVQVQVLARDTEGGPATIQSLAVHNLAGDYDGSLSIDFEDVTRFLVAWNQTPRDISADIGPATGKVPDLRPVKDGKLDFEDLMVLAQMWNWSTGTYVPAAKPAMAGEPSDLLQIKSVALGNEVRMELGCQAGDLMAAGLELTYDPSAWELVEVNPGPAFPDPNKVLLLRQDAEPGRSVVLLGSLTGLATGNKPLAYLLFAPRGQGREELLVSYDLRNQEGKKVAEGAVSQRIQPVPNHFFLAANAPNPFNPSTLISFGLPMPAVVSLKIYDILGQEVAVLLGGEHRIQGYYQVRWDGTNTGGRPVGSGVYLYRLTVLPEGGSVPQEYIHRMLLLK